MTTRRAIDPVGLVFGVGAPVLAAAAGILLTSAWRTRLPDRIITHWSAHGPDQWGSPAGAAWQFALLTGLIGAGMGSVAALAPALLLMRRTMLVLALTFTGVMTALQLGMLAAQLDHATADAAAPGVAALPAGALAGFAVGIAAAARLRDHRVRAEADAPPAADLPRAPANGPIRDALGFGWVGLVVIAALLLGLGAVVAVALRGWWPLAAGLPVVVVLTGMMRFDVEADETGVRVRNLGMTSVDIGIEEITGAQVVHVTPFKDYGGWGLRLRRPGSYGIVTRTGPATRIDTASGLTLAITTDKAEELAGALNAWADLRRGVA